MRVDRLDRRMSYGFLRATPFLVIIAVAVRPSDPGRVSRHRRSAVRGDILRSVDAGYVGNPSRCAGPATARACRVPPCGTIRDRRALLGRPWPPWVATPAENQMRYLVLIVMAIAVAGGVVVLTEALAEAGERFYSTLGFAAILLPVPCISSGMPSRSERIAPRNTVGRCLRRLAR